MIKPLFDNVLVKHEHKKETTSSGILLSAHEEESKYAVVVATGDGILADGKKISMPVKVGDKVYYKSYSSEKLEDGGEEFEIVSLSNIYAVIE